MVRKKYNVYYEKITYFILKGENKMETNEIMNNEEAIEETTEEIVKAASRSGLKTATTIGLAMIAGGIACKFVVEPALEKFKIWRASRKVTMCSHKDSECGYDEDFEEGEKDSEE